MGVQKEQEALSPITNHMEVEGELCKLFYEKFGSEALPLIASVFERWGTFLGERMRAKLGELGLKDAAEAYLKPAMEREPKPEILELSDERVMVKIFICPYRLYGAGRPLCEAMMAMDAATIRAMMGGKELEGEFPKSLAAGDECCLAVMKRS
jgi:hypothetical protein